MKRPLLRAVATVVYTTGIVLCVCIAAALGAVGMALEKRAERGQS